MLRIECDVPRVQSSGIRVSDLGFRVSGHDLDTDTVVGIVEPFEQLDVQVANLKCSVPRSGHTMQYDPSMKSQLASRNERSGERGHAREFTGQCFTRAHYQPQPNSGVPSSEPHISHCAYTLGGT